MNVASPPPDSRSPRLEKLLYYRTCPDLPQPRTTMRTLSALLAFSLAAATLALPVTYAARTASSPKPPPHIPPPPQTPTPIPTLPTPPPPRPPPPPSPTAPT